ncbi:MAG: hypothetical protein COV31_00925 [Candidatus Yanofskybacteria bacterium CG10_big_fil_rev_8_21_14_0_10_46_23]|uniref:Major facilitator superfamily (MFS) profile domain-containing protein n=1 Tax=Candidatus Yanofskybacteria bacterium CG10_big_fil_rev_8_21_14_0_10_46_23 TaxID=1975098 RepID=A0A2H0R4M5_9BACT|nr:MAG: hypothetical protein COV31_00925 [Candidatus Yanofskybacteria bacterium CG10_big_fil_rev_8_21_14_0_10_46_23]
MINRVIRNLIWSDIALWFAIGLLAPIFAIFVTENISGGSLRTVGLAASFYWIARSIITLPIGRWMDRVGELGEFKVMLLGSYLIPLTQFCYIFVSQPWHIYLLGFIHGASAAMAVPGWRILFTNHLDRGSTGYEWSVEDVGVGIAIAISSYVGAFVVEKFGFDILFIILGVVGVLGVSIFILPLRKHRHIISKMRTRHLQE